MISMAKILDNGNLGVDVGTLTDDDFTVITQGLTLVIIEQQKIAADASKLIDIFKEAGATELEGTKLVDIAVMHQNANQAVQQCDSIVLQLRRAFNYPANLYAVPLSTVAGIMAQFKPDDE